MKRGLNRAQLKNTALVFMVLDNTYFRFSAEISSVAHLLTRFVAPLFAWLMVDGFFHTRSRANYCKRLWISAFLMQVGNVVSFALFGQRGIADNIFLTLALSFTIIWLFDKGASRKKKVIYRVPAILLIVLALAFSLVLYVPLPFGSAVSLEGGLQLIPFVLISYFFYNNKRKQAVFTLAYCFGLFFVFYGGFEAMSQGFDMFCVNSDWMTFLVIPFIFLYNGEEGRKSKFGKWFFYIFYPLHLWILAIIGNVIL